MMAIVPVCDYGYPEGWKAGDERSRHYCERLEMGDILFFPRAPFAFSEHHKYALLDTTQGKLRFDQNVSYQPEDAVVRGLDNDNEDSLHEMQTIMRDYSTQAARFIADFLRPYQGHWKLDLASYRPVEEAKRNKLLHVDAMPSRPTAGGRILRVFCNLNPRKSRIWITGEPFERLALVHAKQAGLRRHARRIESMWWGIWRSTMALGRRLWGKKTPPPAPYDEFMQRFRNYLKHNEAYQKGCPKQRWEFPPGSCWLVYTDSVAHAVLSGQCAIEQTFIIDAPAMLRPELAPVHILERMCGQRLRAA